jgi:uncharacterized protein (TIGR01777 family)
VRVLIAGGSGFLGQKLAVRLGADGHQVQILTRRSSNSPDAITWKPDGAAGSLPQHLEAAGAVVNLAGESLARWPWTAARKEALRTSRILSTHTIASAIAACARPPRIFVSGSAVGYYGPHGDEPVTEATPPGTDFLARLCVEWEQEARAAERPGTRLCIVRTGLALSTDGGALPTMIRPFKFGVGGPLGSGQQYVPWIHVDDWTAMVMWMIQTDGATGAFNASAPTPVTGRTFAHTLGRALGRPAILPAPASALRLVMGDMADMVLNGQRQLPVHAEQLGFQFSYRALEPALQSLLMSPVAQGASEDKEGNR